MFGSGKVGVQGRAPASLRGLTSFIARVGLRAADGETQAPARPDDARQAAPRIRRLQAQIARSTGLAIRRAPGCLWAKAGCRLGTASTRREQARGRVC